MCLCGIKCGLYVAVGQTQMVVSIKVASISLLASFTITYPPYEISVLRRTSCTSLPHCSQLYVIATHSLVSPSPKYAPPPTGQLSRGLILCGSTLPRLSVQTRVETRRRRHAMPPSPSRHAVHHWHALVSDTFLPSACLGSRTHHRCSGLGSARQRASADWELPILRRRSSL